MYVCVVCVRACICIVIVNVSDTNSVLSFLPTVAYSYSSPQWFSRSDGFIFTYSIMSQDSLKLVPAFFEDVVKGEKYVHKSNMYWGIPS